MPAKVEPDKKRGFIVPIGGAEDKDGCPIFCVASSRSPAAKGSRIVVIPTASKLEGHRAPLREALLQLGADEAKALRSSRPTTARATTG